MASNTGSVSFERKSDMDYKKVSFVLKRKNWNSVVACCLYSSENLQIF